MVVDGSISAMLFGLSFSYRLLWNIGVGWGDPPDVAQYVKSGQLLFEGRLLENNALMPLYPVFIHVFGYDGVITAQYVLSASSAVVLYWLGRRLFASRAVGMFAGMLFIISPTLIFWSNLRLTESLYIFVLLLAVLLLVMRRHALFAVAITVATLVRPTVDLIAPLLTMLPFVLERNYRAALRAAGIFLVIYTVLMLPWWAHNYARYGRFVRLNLASGPVLLLENNPEFEKTGLDFAKVFGAFTPYYKLGNEVQVNDAMEAAAIHYIVTNKQDFYRNSLDRARRFLTVFPDINPEVDPVFTTYLSLVYLLAFLFVIRMTRADVIDLAPVLVIISFVTAVHIATHAVWRYRAPVEPLLYLLASEAGVSVSRRIPQFARTVTGLASRLPKLFRKSRVIAGTSGGPPHYG
jgi:hypothetical protein